LTRHLDTAALSAMAEGVALELEDGDQAWASAARLLAAIADPANPKAVRVEAEETDDGAWRLVLSRQHHGNVRVSVFDRMFARGADYGVLARSAATFMGLIGAGGEIARGEGERRKSKPVSGFREVMQFLRAEAERSVSKQRYKGLGEMNPEQLWETTMDPTVRRLLRVEIKDAIAADEMFTTLMGDHVEPRRAFIEQHALLASNIDT
jgi:DNA gyrase subunit B